MDDFINLADTISDARIEEFKEMKAKLVSNIIDCKDHGEGVQATLANTCLQCRNEKENKDADAKKWERMQEHAMVPLRYRDSSFDNYYVTDGNQKQQQFKNEMLSYDYNSNLLLIGDTGRGKTHLACALLNRALNSGMSGFYVPYYRAIDYKLHETNIFKQMINYDFLIIDEFGVQDTIFKKNLLQEIIDERYLQCTAKQFKPTIIISNLKLSPSPEEDLTAQVKGIKLTGYFRDAVADATKSRLKENYKYHTSMPWEDYRLKKGGK